MKLFRRCPKCDTSCRIDKKTGKPIDNCPSCGTSVKSQAWFLDYYVNGERKKEAISRDRRFAESVAAKRAVQIKEGWFFDIKKERTRKLQEIAGDFLQYSRNNKRSHDRDVILVNHLTQFFGDKRLDKITPILIEQYKEKRLKTDGRKPATVNREIACLKCMFNWAIKNGKTTANPMKQIRMLKENNARIRYLSKEEIQVLLASCTEQIRPIVLTALMTGMRRGEILGLKWQDVNFQQKILVLKNTKSGRMREIPICIELEQVLRKLSEKSKNEFVFCNEEGQPYQSINSLFQNIVKRSGIKDFHFHDMRHTAASYLIMLGIDIVTVKEILGHSTINMTLRYSHLSPVHKREAMDKLGSQMGPFWAHEGQEGPEPNFEAK